MRNKNAPIRVVIVDDSATMREFLAAILQNDGGFQIVGTGANGEDAIRLVKRLHPDVVTMDVRMPIMNGLEATRHIMRENPTPIVIVTGSVMHKDIELTFKALHAGALTVLNKPVLDDQETCNLIVQMVRLMADVPVIHHWRNSEISTPAVAVKAAAEPLDLHALRNRVQSDIGIIGIASSTGGPATLANILRNLPADFRVPILLVQHVSPGFSSGFAEWLGTQTKLRVNIAQYGDVLQPGVLLAAPDDYHLQINERGIAELTKSPPYRGLRPSANYLFNSLARVYGPQAMGIILTGMGDDGADGMEALRKAGGLTIAQDEASCVVYGMPREAVARNAIDYVLSLDKIEDLLAQFSCNNNIVMQRLKE